MQMRDRLPIRDIENDPDHCGLRAGVQTKDMVIGASAAEEAGIVSSVDWLQIPHGFVKTRRLVEIASDEFDTAHAANEAGHQIAPRNYEPPPRSFFTCAPALPKSICPAKRCLSAAMVRPMSLSVSASISLIKVEIACAASRSDICFGR